MAGTNAKRRDSSRTKLVLVVFVFALIWAGLWFRAGWIQIYKGPLLHALASRQNLAAEFERGERGRIFDRRGNLLATSVESKSLYIRPLEIANPEQAKRRLAAILGIPAAVLDKALGSRSNFVWIKRQITDKQALAVEDLGLAGVYLTTEHNRLYPNGHLAGQVLGFVGVDGAGLEGVERAMEPRLAGGQARFVVQRDAAGRRLYLDDMGREMDIDGRDVRLTIDSHIQSAAEQALAEAVRRYEARAGVAMAVQVKSGEILALANYPFFNPNIYRDTRPELRKPRALTDVYEPGSTLKPFLFAAALEEGAISPDKIFFCENGRWRVGGRTIRDHHPHAWLPAHKVLRYSSNIGSAKIAQSIGAAAYHRYLRGLGFGEPADIGLSGESCGLLRGPEQWRTIDLATIAFGQGVGATALQLARAYLCLANKGLLVPLKLFQDPARPRPEPRRVFSQNTADRVLAMMREVVQEDGTGTRARIPGLTVAGKTGTAQKASPAGGYGDEFMSSFVGLVPGEDPELLFLVLVDEPKSNNYGGVVAAPAVRDMALKSLAYYGRLPDDPADQAPAQAGQAGPDPAQAVLAGQSEPGALVPDIRGLPVRRAMELLMRKGIVPKIKGRGMVVSGQRPVAGDRWPGAEKKGQDDVFILWVS
ncbi:MAG: peptidoglycan synthetase [Desulfovibrionaceae bacterium]|nr:peptidoglycan synthetase [Desulfovibrionaceae bacterium]